jgi:hypothetical protein
MHFFDTYAHVSEPDTRATGASTDSQPPTADEQQSPKHERGRLVDSDREQAAFDGRTTATTHSLPFLFWINALRLASPRSGQTFSMNARA